MAIFCKSFPHNTIKHERHLYRAPRAFAQPYGFKVLKYILTNEWMTSFFPGLSQPKPVVKFLATPQHTTEGGCPRERERDEAKERESFGETMANIDSRFNGPGQRGEHELSCYGGRASDVMRINSAWRGILKDTISLTAGGNKLKINLYVPPSPGKYPEGHALLFTNQKK